MDIDNIIKETLREIKNPPMKLINKVKISEELKFHIDNKISLTENLFRIYWPTNRLEKYIRTYFLY